MTAHQASLSAPTTSSSATGVRKLLELALMAGVSLPYIVFGLNKFFLFANIAPPAGADAQAFLGAMFTSYLAKLVGIAEIAGGALYLFRRTQFLGVLVLMPVVVNIVVFHLVHDLPGNSIWLLTTPLYCLALYKHRAAFATLVPRE